MMTQVSKNWADFTNPNKQDLFDFSLKYEIDTNVLTDCLEPNHLPKKEMLEGFTFIILRYFDKKVKELPSSIQDMSNKIAIFYNSEIIITVHRNPILINSFISIEPDIKPSEIVTNLMLFVLNTYDEISFDLSTKIDNIEKEIFVNRYTNVSLSELYFLKNSCRLCRKVNELNGNIINTHITIDDDISNLQNVKDHLKKLDHSFGESYEDSHSLSSMYMSIVSIKTNDVMKVLTIFSAFFMPLTFIVGIYGMNFKYMPELESHLGYPFVWFKRKKIL